MGQLESSGGAASGGKGISVGARWGTDAPSSSPVFPRCLAPDGADGALFQGVRIPTSSSKYVLERDKESFSLVPQVLHLPEIAVIPTEELGATVPHLCPKCPKCPTGLRRAPSPVGTGGLDGWRGQCPHSAGGREAGGCQRTPWRNRSTQPSSPEGSSPMAASSQSFVCLAFACRSGRHQCLRIT